MKRNVVVVAVAVVALSAINNCAPQRRVPNPVAHSGSPTDPNAKPGAGSGTSDENAFDTVFSSASGGKDKDTKITITDGKGGQTVIQRENNKIKVTTNSIQSPVPTCEDKAFNPETQDLSECAVIIISGTGLNGQQRQYKISRLIQADVQQSVNGVNFKKMGKVNHYVVSVAQAGSVVATTESIELTGDDAKAEVSYTSRKSADGASTIRIKGFNTDGNGKAIKSANGVIEISSNPGTLVGSSIITVKDAVTVDGETNQISRSFQFETNLDRRNGKAATTGSATPTPTPTPAPAGTGIPTAPAAETAAPAAPALAPGAGAPVNEAEPIPHTPADGTATNGGDQGSANLGTDAGGKTALNI